MRMIIVFGAGALVSALLGAPGPAAAGAFNAVRTVGLGSEDAMPTLEVRHQRRHVVRRGYGPRFYAGPPRVARPYGWRDYDGTPFSRPPYTFGFGYGPPSHDYPHRWRPPRNERDGF